MPVNRLPKLLPKQTTVVTESVLLIILSAISAFPAVTVRKIYYYFIATLWVYYVVGLFGYIICGLNRLLVSICRSRWMARPGKVLPPCLSLVFFPGLSSSLHICGEQICQEKPSNEQIQCKCSKKKKLIFMVTLDGCLIWKKAWQMRPSTHS